MPLCRIERERDYFRLKEAEKFRAEADYEEFRLRRAEEHRAAEQQLIQERIARESASREYEARVQEERLARAAKDNELEIQQRLAEEAEMNRAETLAVSRRAELQRKEQVKSEIDRESLAVLDEQKAQQKLELELAEI